jgi:hypothetical protein
MVLRIESVRMVPPQAALTGHEPIRGALALAATGASA